MATGKIDVNKFLFPQGKSVDITEQLKESGSKYTCSVDCVIKIRFYDSYCSLLPNKRALGFAIGTGGATPEYTDSGNTNEIWGFGRAGCIFTLWTTNSEHIRDITMHPCDA